MKDEAAKIFSDMISVGVGLVAVCHIPVARNVSSIPWSISQGQHVENLEDRL